MTIRYRLVQYRPDPSDPRALPLGAIAEFERGLRFLPLRDAALERQAPAVSLQTMALARQQLEGWPTLESPNLVGTPVEFLPIRTVPANVGGVEEWLVHKAFDAEPPAQRQSGMGEFLTGAAIGAAIGALVGIAVVAVASGGTKPGTDD